MNRAFVGVGSNIHRDKSVRAAVARLREEFGALQISTVYESPAWGFEGDNFYNLVVAFETGLAPLELTQQLHAIETDLGRKRDTPRYSSRIIDIDLLLYGALVRHDEDVDIPRPDIRKFAFVLRPLAEIAPDMRHPETGETFTAMWQAPGRPDQELWPVDLGTL